MLSTSIQYPFGSESTKQRSTIKEGTKNGKANQCQIKDNHANTSPFMKKLKSDQMQTICNNHKVSLSDFETLKVLGTGAYGKVFLVRKLTGYDRGKLYAMKVLRKDVVALKTKTLEHTKTERKVLESIRNEPFLVTMHYAFQTKTKLLLILDYVNGGELFTHLYQKDHFHEDQTRIYIAEIVLALERLHKLGIIYRDIKLENILLDSDGHIVLTDFGLCKEFSPDETYLRTYSFCGTIEYMSPELIKGGVDGHDFSVDWWSVGVLTFELLTGASPFTVDGERNTQAEISKRIIRNSPPIPDHLSPNAKDFIKRLLVKDPIKRLGGSSRDAEELKAHPFLSSINWSMLISRKIAAPFLPCINHELDVSNFAEEFTSMDPDVLANRVDGCVQTARTRRDEDDDCYTSSDESYEQDSIMMNNRIDFRHISQSDCNSLSPETSETNIPTHEQKSGNFDVINTSNQISTSQSLYDLTQMPSKYDCHPLYFNSSNSQTYFKSKRKNIGSILHSTAQSKSNGSVIIPHNNVSQSFCHFNLKRNERDQYSSNIMGLRDAISYSHHYSKLFRGYSYTKPEALGNESKETKYPIRPNSSLSDIGEYESSSSCSNMSDNISCKRKKIFESSKQRESSQLTYDIKDALISKNSKSKVAFTIGDGEDLSSAFEKACRTRASEQYKLSILDGNDPRGISLKVHYTEQKLYCQQPSSVIAAKCVTPLKSMTNDSNDSSTISYSKRRVDKFQSTSLDWNSEFFKSYELEYPFNSEEDVLGRGACSVTKRCVHRKSGKQYAVKIVSKIFDCSLEVDILRQCQGCPNVVRLYDVFYDQFNTYIVMQLLSGGELFTKIKEHEITEQRAKIVFKSLALTIQHLHSNGYAHRDIKPENILFVDNSPDSEIRLIDFGFACKIPRAGSGMSMNSTCATLDYCAPEVLKCANLTRASKTDKQFQSLFVSLQTTCKSGYNETCDLWSLGVTLYAMLCGSLPYRTYKNNSDEIERTNMNFKSSIWQTMSNEAKDLIVSLLKENPSERASISDILQSKWISRLVHSSLNSSSQRDNCNSLKSSKSHRSKTATTQTAFTMCLRERRPKSAASEVEEKRDVKDKVNREAAQDAKQSQKKSIKRYMNTASVVRDESCKRSRLSVVFKIVRCPES